MPDIMRGHVQTSGGLKGAFSLGLHVARAGSRLTFGIWTWPSITAWRKLYMQTISVGLGSLDKSPFRKYMSLYTHTHKEVHGEMYTQVHSAHMCSQSPLMESPGCQINSVTFEVIYSLFHRATEVDEEPRYGCVETFDT